MSADDFDADDPVAELLAGWRARIDRGEDVTIEDLAREHPAVADTLRRRAAALEIAATRLRTPDAVPAGADLPPVRIARYEGFRPAGEGGMGIVYWALDTELNREVAFKVVRPSTADRAHETPKEPFAISPPPRGTPASSAFETLKSRFLQEACVTAGMAHPGIVPVYELGTTPEGVPYYTMRFVRGSRSLATAISEAAGKGLEARLALLEPFLKVCDTIRYAHARGVIHRDLKPANIALGNFGEVVVLDWGLAKVQDQPDASGHSWVERIHALRDTRDLKTLASALGTPGYMSPEAALGRLDEVDARSDVYSLGAILFEILTGKLPYEFQSFGELVRKMLAGAPAAPSEADPAIPEPLSRACLQALATNRDARQESAEALAAQVRAWQTQRDADREADRLVRDAAAALVAAGELRGDDRLRQLDRAAAAAARARELLPSHADAQRIEIEIAALRRRGVEEREALARRQTLRRATVATLALAAAAAVAVAFVIDGKRREATDARAETATALVAEKAARDAAEEEGRRAHALALAHASARHLAADPMLALLLARESVRVRQTASAMAALRAAVSASRERAMLRPFGSVTTAAVARSAGTIAAGTADGSVCVWHAGGKPLCTTEPRHFGVTALDVSTDGRLVVAGYADGAAELRNADGYLVSALAPHATPVTLARLSPAGDRVLVIDGGKGSPEAGARRARMTDAAGREVASIELPAGAAAWGNFSADGSRAFLAQQDGTIRIFDRSGTETARFRAPTQAVRLARFASSGDRIAVVSAKDNVVHVLDAAGAELFQAAAPQKDAARDVRFSNDGRRVVVNDWTGLRVLGASGELVADVKMPQEGSTVLPVAHALAWSQDGSRFAFSTSDDVIHVHAADGRAEALLRGHRGHVRGLLFTDGDRGVVSASPDDGLKTWDLAGGDEAALLGHTGPVQDAHWSADGARILTASEDGTARLWTPSGQPLATLRGSAAPVGRAVFTPDGRRIVTASADGIARIFDADGHERAALSGHTEPIWHLAVSPDGRRIATTSGDGTARLWDGDGAFLATLQTAKQPLVGVAFSPDGSLVVTSGADYSARVSDARDGTQRAAMAGGHTGHVAFAPDGRSVLTTHGVQDAALYALDGTRLALLRGHTLWISGLGFSPDGARLVTASMDGTARIWDRTGRSTATLNAQGGPVTRAAFDRTGERVLTSSDDTTARLWSVDGRELVVFAGHASRVLAAELSPDGRRVVTASEDGTARVWLVDDADLLALAERRITRDFERGELERLADVLGERAARGLAAHRLADDRLAKDVLVADAIASVEGDGSLAPELRRDAVTALRARHDDGDGANQAAWDVVTRAGLDAETYRRAVRWATEADRLRPRTAGIVNTLGASEFRAGDFAKALATLQRSEQLATADDPAGTVEDAAFLAMTLAALGRADEAAAALATARTRDTAEAASGAPGSREGDVHRRLLEEAAGAVEAAKARKR